MDHVRKYHTGASRCPPATPCFICEAFVCARCHGSSGGGWDPSLPVDCPGVPMTEAQERAVFFGEADFVDGRWIITKREVEGAGLNR